MKIIVQNYTFDASAQTIEFDDYGSIALENILAVLNVTDGIVIFASNTPAKGGSVATNVLTLEHDTTSMADADDLQIFYWDADVEQPITVASLPLPSGAATSAKQDTGNTSLASIDGKITAVDTGAVVVSSSALPSGASTSAKQDTIIGHLDGVETTLTAIDERVDGVEGLLTTIDGDTGNISTKIDTLAGAVAGTEMQVDVLTMPGLTDAELRATPVPVSGTVAVTNAGLTELAAAIDTEVQVDIVGALPAGTNNIGDVDVLSLPALPSGTNNIGDVDVLTLPALPAGTNNIGAVTIAASASGGDDTFHLVSAGSTNATNIKASAGCVTGWYIYNSNAAARKVVFHNTAGTPTAGASVFSSLVIPPTSGANVSLVRGQQFSTGIAITTVTGLADNDTTAVAANDLIINIFYK